MRKVLTADILLRKVVAEMSRIELAIGMLRVDWRDGVVCVKATP